MRQELIEAIGALSAFERAQLLLYILEDDRDPFRVIDSPKWRWHEARSEGGRPVPKSVEHGTDRIDLFGSGSSEGGRS